MITKIRSPAFDKDTLERRRDVMKKQANFHFGELAC